MPAGKKLYSYVEVDDKTPVQKLKLSDQLRLLLRKLTEDPANELRSEDAVTAKYLQLYADCLDFIKKAAKPLREGEHTCVYVQVSNEFKPVLHDVLTSKDIATYYHVLVAKPKIEYDISFEYLLKIELRSITNEINDTD